MDVANCSKVVLHSPGMIYMFVIDYSRFSVGGIITVLLAPNFPTIRLAALDIQTANDAILQKLSKNHPYARKSEKIIMYQQKKNELKVVRVRSPIVKQHFRLNLRKICRRSSLLNFWCKVSLKLQVYNFNREELKFVIKYTLFYEIIRNFGTNEMGR